LLSGRFLLGLLFLWISNVLLFNLGADLSFLGIKSFLNRKLTVRSLSAKENLFTRKVLVWRKYIEFDPASKKVGAGQRIDELYELIERFGSSEEEDPIPKLKDSLARDVWQLCFGFALIYFLVLPYHNIAVCVNWFIVVCLVMTPIAYVGIEKISEILTKSKTELIAAIKFLIFQREVLEQLNKLGCNPYKKTEESGQEEYISVAGIELILVIYNGRQSLDEFRLKSYYKLANEKGRPVALIMNSAITCKVQALAQAIEDSVLVYCFPDEVDLKETLWRKFFYMKKELRVPNRLRPGDQRNTD
jgi:hypothetical protein